MNAKAFDVLKGPGGYALVVLAGGVVIWMLWDKIGETGKKAADAAGGLLSGNNDLTRNQTNVDGEKVTAYEGRGILGTLGAGANTASGGVLASAGEAVGGWLFDIFGPKVK